MKKTIVALVALMAISTAVTAESVCYADGYNGDTRIIISRRDKHGREIGIDYRPTNRKGDQIGIWTRF